MSTTELLSGGINNVAPMEFWAFFENSDFQRKKKAGLYRQDEVLLIRHDAFLDVDYQLMVDIGCVGIRDAVRWYITHPAPNRFDWDWLDRVVAAAHKYNLKLYLDLWHYGYPDWLDLMSPEAPAHFANFARQIALRYPSLKYYSVCNEPSLMVDYAGKKGRWRPFLRGEKSANLLQNQICRAIIQASKAILEVTPDAVLVLPEPWHTLADKTEADQAAILDTVLGLRNSELGGSRELVTFIGLNHYRDRTVPPFHRLLENAQRRWPDKTLWLTETSGPPTGWKQSEWFWWMMAETRLAKLSGVNLPVFTWAPIISMYDWVYEERQLHNGIWTINANGAREPDALMLESLKKAREYGYIL
jgi:hypothetical protein